VAAGESFGRDCAVSSYASADELRIVVRRHHPDRSSHSHTHAHWDVFEPRRQKRRDCLVTHKGNAMFKAKLIILAAAGALITGSASAMPLSNLGETLQGDPSLQQVRLVCNDRGHCWRTSSRRYERSYQSRTYSESPRYGYGAYGVASPYGYRQAPGVGINLRF
jgi:hypothetical protein